MEHPHIQLRQASLADTQTIIRMRGLFAEELAGRQPAEAEAIMRASLQEYLESELNNTCICWLAESGGAVVSIMMMVLRRQPGSLKNPSGRWGYLMNVYTLPAFRRQGIAAKLLDAITNHTRQLGYTAIELHATRDGAPLYEQAGFIVHAEPTFRKYQL